MRRPVLHAFALACVVVVLLAARVGGTTQAGGAQAASQEDWAKANLLLDDAARYVELKDPASAQQRILEALAAARTDEGVRKRAGELWAKASEQAAQAAAAKADEQKKKDAEEAEKTKRNQLARLEEAERKAARGDNDAAATVVLEVLKETKDKDVVEKAEALIKNNRPETSAVLRKNWDTIWSWAQSVIIVGLLLLVLWRLLLRPWRHVWATSKNYSWRRIGGYVFSHWGSSNSFREAERKGQDEDKEFRRWVVGAVHDRTKLGVGEAPTTSSGPLKESSAPG